MAFALPHKETAPADDSGRTGRLSPYLGFIAVLFVLAFGIKAVINYGQQIQDLPSDHHYVSTGILQVTEFARSVQFSVDRNIVSGVDFQFLEFDQKDIRRSPGNIFNPQNTAAIGVFSTVSHTFADAPAAWIFRTQYNTLMKQRNNTTPDAVVLLPGLSQAVCHGINTKNSVMSLDAKQGSIPVMTTISRADLARQDLLVDFNKEMALPINEPSFCAQTKDGHYFYIHTILAR